MPSKTQLEMIKEFQCPGCSCGVYPDTCKAFKFYDNGCFYCEGWHPSTFQGGVGWIAPRGFCRTGMVDFGGKPFTYVRL